MKAIMGFGFFLLFLAGIALVLLQGREMARQNMPAGGAGMTGRDWRPALLGSDTLPADSGMFVRFAVDGSVNGHGGCNRFSGALQQTASGIAVGELGLSRLACAADVMRREAAFVRALQDATRFETGERRLQLLDANGQLLAELATAN